MAQISGKQNFSTLRDACYVNLTWLDAGHHKTGAANMQRFYAEVRWQVQDVLDDAKDRGVEITTEQAAEILHDSERAIEEAMIERGWEVIGNAVEDYEPESA